MSRCLIILSNISIFILVLAAAQNTPNSNIGHILKFFHDIDFYMGDEVPDKTPTDREEYDFIIVGSGSAGSTLASRLSENENISILVIEAGGHEGLVMDVPLLALFLQFNPPTNWGFKTEPSNSYCLGFENQQCNLPLGKVKGGGSTVNWMIATRGNKRDYDEWAELTGDESWSYNNMFNYFKKLENFQANLSEFERDMHNFDGPVRIANVPYRTPIVEAFTEAGREVNLPPIDFNGRKQSGYSYMQTNQINGERMSANRAYLHPVRNRKNLKVSIHSRVTQILIEPTTKTAYGVRFIKTTNSKSVVREVYAKREVIISAGACNTPKLLMFAGIGPSEHLREMGIEVLQDLPGVGKNLMDHIGFGGLTFLVNDSVSLDIRSLVNPMNWPMKEYGYDRKGPYTMLAGLEGIGFIDVDDPYSPRDEPSIELMMGGVHFGSDPSLHQPFRMKEINWKRNFYPNLYKHGWLVWPMITRPKSRGELLLRNSDPLSKPRIITNYLSHPEDVRIGVKGIREAIKLSQTKAMQKYGSTLVTNIIPGCERFEYDSDAYWECGLRTYTMTIWHLSGTCKMGNESDRMAVVDSKLKVRGISRLRVIDASIFPNIPNGHINIPTIAVAEKAADELKNYWGL